MGKSFTISILNASSARSREGEVESELELHTIIIITVIILSTLGPFSFSPGFGKRVCCYRFINGVASLWFGSLFTRPLSLIFAILPGCKFRHGLECIAKAPFALVRNGKKNGVWCWAWTVLCGWGADNSLVFERISSAFSHCFSFPLPPLFFAPYCAGLWIWRGRLRWSLVFYHNWYIQFRAHSEL